MARPHLIQRLAGMVAICLAVVASPLDDTQRVSVLAALAIGVAVSVAVPWSDRWVSRSVIAAVLVPASGLPLIALALGTSERIEPVLVTAWGAAVAISIVASAAGWPGDSPPPLGRPATEARGVHSHRQALAAAAVLLVVAPVAFLVAVAITSLTPQLLAAPTAGDPAGPELDAHPGLGGDLDVGTPLDLSDEVVLRVRADRPNYWRGATYEEWNGRYWTSRLTPTPVHLTDGGAAELAAFDDSRSAPAELELPEPATLTQHFTAERAGLDVLFGSWRIQSYDAPVDRALVSSDGSVRLDEALGAGAVWTAVSEEIPATAADLRRADPLQIDDGAVDRRIHATEDAVSDAVAQLARDLTADAPTTYDKVRAIESWMDANLTYTREISALPAGRDALDHLLFESRRGYCEQIGSALVVMLRSLGIPARLAIGYVPSDYDAATGSWISRASDAHTWAEVYFPGVGWRGFDPTAGVPSAVDEAPASALATGPSTASGALLIVAVLLGLWLVLTPVRRRRFPGTSLPDLWTRLGPRRRPADGGAVDAVLALHRRLDRCGSRLPEAWAPTMTVRDRAHSMIAGGVDPDTVMATIRALERVTFGADVDGEPHEAAVSAAEAAMDALEAAIVSRASATKREGTGRWPNAPRRDRAARSNPSRTPVP